MNKDKLKNASLYYLVGSLFNRGISFLTVPIFSRILSTSDYGIVTTYNSWISILSVVIGFAIHMGIRAAFVDYEKEIDDVVSVTTTFTLLSGAVLGLFVGLGSILLNVNVSLMLIVLCVLQGISSALVQNYSMYLMMQYRYKFRTALMILPNLISAIVSIIAIVFILDSNLYLGRIIPSALVSISFGIIIVVLSYKKSNMFFNKKYLKYCLAISSPLVLHSIAQYILSQSDRTMITLFADSSQTGIYSLIYNFGMVASVITTSLEGVWVPWFTVKLKQRELNAINQFAKKYINVMASIMVCLVLVGPEIVKLLADKKYWEGISIIPPVILSYFFIFAYTLYVNIEHFYKKTPYITLNTIIAAVINLVLNFIFIPQYGYVAAAYTTLISYFISFVLHARYAKRIERDLYPLKYFFTPLVSLVCAIAVFYILYDVGIARWIVAIVYALFVLYKERDIIAEMMPSFAAKFRRKNSAKNKGD